mgnify:FL=1
MNNEKEYHKARRMFFLIDEKLVIAENGSEYSHFEWLKKQGCSDEKVKNFIKTELRGVLNPDGNLRFYVGEDFEVNEKIEKDFFRILPELVEKLNIRVDSEIGGGTIRQEIGKFWPEKKKYGKVGDFIDLKGLRKTTLGFLIKDNKILLAMKKRGFGPGKWNGVGGKMHDGETIEETSKREIMEEISVLVKKQEIVGKIKFYFKDNQDWDQEVVVFKIIDWENEPQESEEMAPQWIDINKIPYDKMWIDDRFWLPKVLAGEKIEAKFVFGNDDQKILEMEVKKLF